jgi:hypothetical protein
MVGWGLSLGRRKNVSRLRRAFAVSAIWLCAAAGLTFGLAVPSALADDPPPTTVPTPTLPAPDPAPPKPKPTPKPKPVSHPAPRPVHTTRVYHAPTPAPVVPSSTRPTVHVQVKPKKKVVRHKKAIVKKKVVPTTTTTTATLPTVTVLTTAGAAVGVPSAFHSKSGGDGSLNFSSILIVFGLGVAIACFAVALVPATAVKWRPAAIFVSERQVDLTVVGLALLVAAAFIFFWTKGP